MEFLKYIKILSYFLKLLEKLLQMDYVTGFEIGYGCSKQYNLARSSQKTMEKKVILSDVLPALKGCPSGNLLTSFASGASNAKNPAIFSDEYLSDSSHTNQQYQRYCNQRFLHKHQDSRNVLLDNAI